MKKLLTLFFALNFYAVSVAQIKIQEPSVSFILNKLRATSSSSVCLRDSTVMKNWDQPTNAWKYANKEIYFYDTHFNLTTQYNYYYYTSSNPIYSGWTMTGRMTFAYNTNNNITSQLQQSGNLNTSWINQQQTTYSYDSQHNLITELEQTWNSSSNTWKNDFQITFMYNSIHQNTTQINQSWNPGTNHWENNEKIDFNYDISGNIFSISIFTLNPNTSTWGNEYKITATYNGNNRLSSYTSQSWNAMTNTWDNSEKVTYTYDNNNNIISEATQSFNLVSNTWENEVTVNSTYDSRNNKTSELYLDWDPNHTPSPTWVNSNISYAYYNCTTVGIKDNLLKTTTFRIYPNPAQSHINIETEEDFKSVHIITLNGQVVVTQENSKIIPVSQLESGIYFIQLLDKKGAVVQTEKFIKE